MMTEVILDQFLKVGGVRYFLKPVAAGLCKWGYIGNVCR